MYHASILLITLIGLALLPGTFVLADETKDSEARAVMLDREGERIGEARLWSGSEGVVIRLELQGLTGGWKGLHIHAKGTCEDFHAGFLASGGHLDPDGRQHGLLNPNGPERGDLPNIWINNDGRVKVEIYVSGITIKGGKAGLLDGDGTALVIHEDEDDHDSQPIGGAGSRIACGVIVAAD